MSIINKENPEIIKFTRIIRNNVYKIDVKGLIDYINDFCGYEGEDDEFKFVDIEGILGCLDVHSIGGLIVEYLEDFGFNTKPLEYLLEIRDNRELACRMRDHARYHAYGNLHRHSEGEIEAMERIADEIDENSLVIFLFFNFAA